MADSVAGVALLSQSTSRHSVVAVDFRTCRLTVSYSAGISVVFCRSGDTILRTITVLYSAGTAISRVVAGVLSTVFFAVVYSAGIWTSCVVAGVARTSLVTVLYSAGTSTRHRMSPAPGSIARWARSA